MTIAILVYLVALLPKLATFFGAAATITAFVVVAWGLFALLELDFEAHWKSLRNLILLAVVFAGVHTMIPSEKTAWLMLGGYAVQTAYESEEGQQYRKLIHKKVQEALGETVEQVKKDK